MFDRQWGCYLVAVCSSVDCPNLLTDFLVFATFSAHFSSLCLVIGLGEMAMRMMKMMMAVVVVDVGVG